MPVWTSMKQIESELRKARLKSKKMREKHGGDSKEFKDAIKECNAIQQIKDRWPAIQSKW